VRVASNIELHVRMHEGDDGRLMAPYINVTYTDVQHRNDVIQVLVTAAAAAAAGRSLSVVAASFVA